MVSRHKVRLPVLSKTKDQIIDLIPMFCVDVLRHLVEGDQFDAALVAGEAAAAMMPGHVTPCVINPESLRAKMTTSLLVILDVLQTKLVVGPVICAPATSLAKLFGTMVLSFSDLPQLML